MEESPKKKLTFWSKTHLDLASMIAVLILMSVFIIVGRIATYKFGLTLDSFWFGLEMLLLLFIPASLVMILFLVIRLAVLNVRYGTKRFLLQIIILTVTIVFFMQSPMFFGKNTKTFLQGFHANMKANADINAIQDWLDSLDWDSLEKEKDTGRAYIPPRLWPPWDPNQLKIEDFSDFMPETIKNLPLYPNTLIYLMKSADNKRYIRIQFGGGAVLVDSWFLVVGVGANEIHIDEYFYDHKDETEIHPAEREKRLGLTPNAFVGFVRDVD